MAADKCIKKIPLADWYLVSGEEMLRLRKAADAADLRKKVCENLLKDNFRLRRRLARWEGVPAQAPRGLKKGK